MLDLPWRDVQSQMQDDVRRVMLRVNEQRYTQGIDKDKKPAEWAAASARSIADTDAYYGLIEASAKQKWISHNGVQSADQSPATPLKTAAQVYGYEDKPAADAGYQKPTSQYQGYTGGR